jgi:hypothetical protein
LEHGTGATGGHGIAYTVDDFETFDKGLPVAKLSEEQGFVKREGEGFRSGDTFACDS